MYRTVSVAFKNIVVQAEKHDIAGKLCKKNVRKLPSFCEVYFSVFVEGHGAFRIGGTVQ
jgi:hypothetical protein